METSIGATVVDTSLKVAGGQSVKGADTVLSREVEAFTLETSIGETNPLVETGGPVEKTYYILIYPLHTKMDN